MKSEKSLYAGILISGVNCLHISLLSVTEQLRTVILSGVTSLVNLVSALLLPSTIFLLGRNKSDRN